MDVADMDVVYLTYDEPQKEEFWVKIKQVVPWAVRVDGVKGSDAAHKAAADASTTDWFVLIDGDNIPDSDFFNQVFEEPDVPSAYRWKAVNAVNSLMYGNGGLCIWHKDFVKNMRTHENSDGQDKNNTEFCFDPNYHAMWNVYSTTYPNQSAFHAWRAGFREGVKMCLRQGVRPSLEEFDQLVHSKNLDNLLIWMSVGTDAEHGDQAMEGARYGVYKTMLTDWDYTEVQDFDKLAEIWDSPGPQRESDIGFDMMGETLEHRLGIQMVDYDVKQSEFFKHFYVNNYQPQGFMTKEIDVIRKREQW